MRRFHDQIRALLAKPAALAIAASVISFLVFLPALRNGFVPSWDDGTNLTENLSFRGLGWPQLKWMWTNHLMDHYVPLAWMSFGFDYRVWKLDPYGYHLTSIVLHACNAGLLLWLTVMLLRLALPAEFGRSQRSVLAGATFAALLFGLHPLRVESVAWATERRDVLSGLFYLLALIAYVRPFRTSTSERSHTSYWASLMLFVAAVLSKEIAVTLPVILLILDVYPLQRLGGGPRRWRRAEFRQVWLEKIPFFAVSLADSAMTLYVAVKNQLPDSLSALGWIGRFGITMYGMAFYLLKTVVPLRLSALYPVTGHKIDPRGLPFLLSLALVLGISGAAWVLRRKIPGLLAAWLAYTVTLLPVGGLVHNGFQIAADRYTYLSCLGWAILAGAAVAWLFRPGIRWLDSAAITAAGLLVLGALAWMTHAQIGYWRDAETLWDRAVRMNPDSPPALANLGTELFHNGDLLGAEQYYRQAVAIAPEFVKAHGDLASILLHEHRADEAIREYRIVQQLAPISPEACTGLGNALVMEGRFDEAIAQYHTALQLRPGYDVAQDNLRAAIAMKQQAARTP